jgi:hypothetical protein
VYIYQLTSALSNLGRFVIIDLSSLSFVVLEIPAASAVSNLVTYYYYSPVCWSAPREQQHTPHIDFWARHSILHCIPGFGLDFSRLAPVNKFVIPNPTKNRLKQQIYKNSHKKKQPPNSVETFFQKYNCYALSYAISYRREKHASRQTDRLEIVAIQPPSIRFFSPSNPMVAEVRNIKIHFCSPHSSDGS